MYFILASTIMVVILTISSGVYLIYKNTDNSKRKLKKALKINLFSFVPLLLMTMVLIAPSSSLAATTGASEVNGLGLLAAALSTGLATIGTGYAVGVVGSSALGAVSEEPKLLGKTLIYVGLAEGIAIYGLVISILILGKL
ncbi:ATP synthase subunit C [Miniphocaeibacter halophilus]|uniref:ATPase n=1 Tax=Miniphocaeibacter halophilus TaxID=2931922 RepID=A0AC61MPC4_9FIRM|nr:ATP synthase subunit C [Miniphocaeibacter halophilus]QQK07359.1 ATPase [Miniphocaeibacter halophilus]